MNEAYAEYEEYDDEYESDLCACPNCGGELKVNEDCGVECTKCEEFIGWYIPSAGAVKLLDKWAGHSANWWRDRQEVSAMSKLADKLFDRLEEIADPEIAMQRAVSTYRRKGYLKNG